MIKLFNDCWSFSKKPLGTEFESISDWKPVDIPHDWLIHQVNNLYETSEGWYKKTFNIEEIKDKVFKINFEGVYFDTSVYVNDNHVGDWKYGYSTFEFDITDSVQQGENLVVVKVCHQSPNTRWYSGAGIYRSIYLKELNKTHINTNGVYISTSHTDDKWCLDIQTEIVNLKSPCTLKHTVIDKNGETVLVSEKTVSGADEITVDNVSLEVENPELWGLNNPTLYTLWTELSDSDENSLDDNLEDFGFREIKYDCNKGFFLNGEHTKLYGVCLHHDLGALGAAVNYSATKRQLEIMKEMKYTILIYPKEVSRLLSFLKKKF